MDYLKKLGTFSLTVSALMINASAIAGEALQVKGEWMDRDWRTHVVEDAEGTFQPDEKSAYTQEDYNTFKQKLTQLTEEAKDTAERALSTDGIQQNILIWPVPNSNLGYPSNIENLKDFQTFMGIYSEHQSKEDLPGIRVKYYAND